MSKSSGLTRGDRNRNGRLGRLRALVPSGHAIVGVDLGDRVQMVVVTDRDSRVLARRKFTGKAFQLGEVLEWAAAQAVEGGFAGVTVGCEPTGSRWMQVQQLAAERGLLFVCVQPMATARAREADDYTRDKTDYRDAVLIARLVGQLSCYVPEQADESWALLRHQGARRAKLITSRTANVQLVQSMLELAWPAVLDAAADPFDSMNWKAAMAVVLDRSDGRPEKLRTTMSRARFTTAVRRELPRWGGQQIRRRIIDAVYDVLTSTDGAVPAQRRAALQRAGWAIDDLRAARPNLERIETEMVDQLSELGLAELVSTIPGLTPTTAAAILAETGDPARFDSARSMVKHAGISPAENTSGQHTGRTRITKRGRPRLRLAAWRAAWAIVRYNPVAAARYQHLTTREKDRLTDHQAIIAIAAAVLRWIHAIATTGQAWNPAIAAGDRPHNQPDQEPMPMAA
jgi:transposase